MSILLLSSCATKNSGFIGAKDYNQPQLPPTAVEQKPTYGVPPATAAESNIVFVKRPRPQPDFIGQAPDNYVPSKIYNRYSQVLSIGYNSRDEVSLLISPFRADVDDSRVQQVFTKLGVRKEQVNEKQGQRYIANNMNINVYSYYNSMMISIEVDESQKKAKKARKKNEPEFDPSANFEFVSNMRELLLEI